MTGWTQYTGKDLGSDTDPQTSRLTGRNPGHGKKSLTSVGVGLVYLPLSPSQLMEIYFSLDRYLPYYLLPTRV